MTKPPRQQIMFICQHGAFRSRIAAAYFNAAAPAGWSATSAGVTPQSMPSERLRPVLAGSAAEPFIDDEPPRPVANAGGDRIIAIDADLPGVETWHTGVGESLSDEEIRDDIRARVDRLVRDLQETPAV